MEKKIKTPTQKAGAPGSLPSQAPRSGASPKIPSKKSSKAPPKIQNVSNPPLQNPFFHDISQNDGVQNTGPLQHPWHALWDQWAAANNPLTLPLHALSYHSFCSWVLRESSECAGKMLQDPSLLLKYYQNFCSDLKGLWTDTPPHLAEAKTTLTKDVQGNKPRETKNPEKAQDKRFAHPHWHEDKYFYVLKESYLLFTRHLSHMTQDVTHGLSPPEENALNFYMNQLADALSPSNFPFTNPAVVEKIIQTNGANLLRGWQNFLQDMAKGQGHFFVSQSCPNAFRVGTNIAATPGHVVFKNHLMEVICYTPSTQKVHATPLLIVPPWINKYYIFDLRSENSFVKWARDQHHQVFIISWVNPDKNLAHLSFEDYMISGLYKAYQIVQNYTRQPHVHLLGYCLGGNLTACFLAYLESLNKNTVSSVTYLASFVDFSRAGLLKLFFNDKCLDFLEQKIRCKGYVEGKALMHFFNMLRPKDLFWSFVVRNYLLGDPPPHLDFLYWNNDTTHLPGKMYTYYLRNMCQHNLLKKPGGLCLGGVSLTLRHIKTPTFILATKEDHIVPWKACYDGVNLYSGVVEFVLASSGHVAGVINPPSAKKYSYFTGTNKPSPHEWLEGAQQHKGSWWPYWNQWIGKHAPLSSRPITPFLLPNALEKAPGNYVHKRIL